MKNRAKRYTAAGLLSLSVIFSGSTVNDNDNYTSYYSPYSKTDIKELMRKNARDITTSRALAEFKSAATVEQACMADTTTATLRDLIDSGVKAPKAATQIIETLSHQDIIDMPTNARIELIRALTDRGMPDGKAFSALKRVYALTTEDIEFAVWDAINQQKLAHRLKDDPVLIEARKNWGAMSKDQKMEALQHVLDLTIDTYGDGLGLRDVTLRAKKMDKNVLGQYIPIFNRLYISKDHLRKGSFNSTAETVVHETMHSIHDQLIEKFRWGKLKENHPLYRQTVLLHATGVMRSYISSDKDYGGYRNTPAERHAFEAENVAVYAGYGPKRTPYGFDEKARKEQQKYDRYKDLRKAALAAGKTSGNCGQHFSP